MASVSPASGSSAGAASKDACRGYFTDDEFVRPYAQAQAELSRRARFDEAGHRYTVDGLPMECSVTGFKSKFVPDFDQERVLNGVFSGSAATSSSARTEGTRAVAKSFLPGPGRYDGMNREEVLLDWQQRRQFGTDIHHCIFKLLSNKAVRQRLSNPATHAFAIEGLTNIYASLGGTADTPRSIVRRAFE